jgi:hypothetical protein
MFEVGKTYEIVTLTAGENGLEESQRIWMVKAIDGHLLHLHVPASDGKKPWSEFLEPMPEQNMVLNTASAFFHSATPVTVEE